ADDGHVQHEVVPGVPTEVGAFEQHKQDDEDRNTRGGINDMIFDRFADAKDEPGESGQLRAFQHAFEDLFERGHDLDHQDDENSRRYDQHGARIKHGGDDLALDLLRLLHELGQPGQNDLEHTAQFTGLDHVH